MPARAPVVVRLRGDQRETAAAQGLVKAAALQRHVGDPGADQAVGTARGGVRVTDARDLGQGPGPGREALANAETRARTARTAGCRARAGRTSPPLPREGVGRALVTHFLPMWEESDVLAALLRVGATDEVGAERMRGVFRDQVLPLARRFCPDPEQVPVRAALVSSHLLGLALTRHVLRFPPAVALDTEEAVAWPAPAVQRCLTAPYPQ
ncbi:TetR/AcrR family transcriptional regulator [Streptomyces sp. NPDC013433]|uniref:TetR/AcrR family transcriptional regulator n=1 Tax=Streptomyces sp. NPDC013433 TaxID=3155604 RepID=UPI003451A30F